MYFTVYSYTSFLKEGFNSKSAIVILDNPFTISVSSSVSFVFSPSLVTLIVYVFVVPSSAVTTTFNAFSPYASVWLPVPNTVAAESCAVAYTSTLSTSSGTVTLYVVVPGVNPEKSFGLIPKLLKFALLDFCSVVVLLELSESDVPSTVIVPPVEYGVPFSESCISSTDVATTLIEPVPLTSRFTLAGPLSKETISSCKVAFPNTVNFTFPFTSFPVTLIVIVSPTLAVDFEKAITSPAACTFGAIAIIITKHIIMYTIILFTPIFIFSSFVNSIFFFLSLS